MVAETEPKLQDAPIECGIYRNVPFEKYLRWRFLSQSVLKQGRELCGGSMKHLKYAMDHVADNDPTDDMIIGSALHVAFLEPGQMADRVVEWRGARRAGKDWEAFVEENADKAILTSGYYRNLFGMVQSLRANKDIADWAKRTTDVEISCVGDLMGLRFRARADALTNDPLLDLKKVSSVDDATVDKTIWNFGYHIQGFIYTELFQRDRFCLGMCEGTPPYDCRVVELSPAWLNCGRKETASIIQRIKWCQKEKRWPGHSESIEMLEPSEWVLGQFGSAEGITIGGAKAFV